MNILQYELNENFALEDVVNVVEYLQNNGVELIVIPKDFSLLLDCDIYTLEYFRNKIDEAIKIKKRERKFDFPLNF
jgi:hypothetical protein